MSAPDLLTGQRAFDLLKEVVAQFGEDYVDPRSLAAGGAQCAYWIDGQPSCIVGQVLHRHGWTGVELMAFAGNVVVLAAKHPGRIFSDACEILLCAQVTQDSGGTWGSALRQGAIMAAHLGYEVE